MPRKGNIIPKAPISRIMKSCGAKRISDDGLDIFSLKLQDYAEGICTQAVKIAKHSGRKTVLDSDLKLAMK
jgi:histone H3/H4